jgi:hypothetical protein
MSWEVPAADAKFTQQLTVDVGDMPGHQVRVFELHRVYPNDKPNCEGLKRVESWNRGYSDYIDRNGRAWSYLVIRLENGDQIFGEVSGTSQTIVAPDGTKNSTYEGTAKWTGGTGKYQGVRGIGWDHGRFNLDTGQNEVKSVVEYWFEK